MFYLDIELGRSNKTIESTARGYKYRRHSTEEKIVNYRNYVGY